MSIFLRVFLMVAMTGPWVVSFAQQPVLLNYPLVKGVYASAIKEGDLLYCMTDFGLMIWDFSDPGSPVLLSKYPAPGPTYAGNMVKSGDKVFIHKWNDIIAIDVSDPMAPAGQPVHLPTGFTHNYLNHIEVRDTLLYAAVNHMNGLMVYDISDIAAPVLVTTLPIFYVDGLQIIDTLLFAHTQNSFHRIDIGAPVPVILDTITIGDGGSLLLAASNTSISVLVVGDWMSGQATAFVYDMETIGPPLLVDSTSIDANVYVDLLTVTDSLLFIGTPGVEVYDISDPWNITVVDTLGGTSYHPRGIVTEAGMAFVMNGSSGIDVHERTGPFTHELLHRHRVGDWMTALHVSDAGLVLAEGRDSVHVFDRSSPVSADQADLVLPQRAHEMAVFGDLLLETRLDGPNSITLSAMSGLQGFDSLTTFHPGSAWTVMRYTHVWDDKLYYGPLQGSSASTNVFSLADPSAPVLLASGIPITFEAWYNGVLYDLYAAQERVDMYDAATMPPQFIGEISYSETCIGHTFWDPQRPMKHVFRRNASSGCYSLLDLSDTANVVVYGPAIPPEMPVWKNELTRVWNGLLYAPVQSGLVIFDACPGHFHEITRLKFPYPPEGIALTDSLLFLSFGGYVARYDVSGILPCLGLGTPEHGMDRDGIVAFPNPSDGSFTLRAPFFGPDAGLEVVDMSGRVVHREVFRAGSDGVQTFHLGLSPGLYMLRLTGGGRVATGKIVVE